MSETTTPAAPGEAADATPPYVPQHVLSSEDDPEPQAEPATGAAETETATEAETENPAKPEKTPEEKARERDNRRYAQAQAARYAEKARADAAEAQRAELAERLRRLEQPDQARTPPAPDIDRLVEERAARLVAEREHATRISATIGAGNSEFGQADFTERCNIVSDLASPEQRVRLMTVVSDMEDGHKAIAALADNPIEAERILAMPPHRMALALAKLATSAPPPAAAVAPSAAPAPIRPPSVGRARGEPDPSAGMDEYVKWESKQRWQR